MNKCMAHRPLSPPHTIADMAFRSQSSFHCIYTQPSNVSQYSISGICWQQITLGMNDKSYLESLLYEIDSITLTAISSIKNQEYQNVITYIK